jgi:hypothetical protein
VIIKGWLWICVTAVNDKFGIVLARDCYIKGIQFACQADLATSGKTFRNSKVCLGFRLQFYMEVAIANASFYAIHCHLDVFIRLTKQSYQRVFWISIGIPMAVFKQTIFNQKELIFNKGTFAQVVSVFANLNILYQLIGEFNGLVVRNWICFHS